MNYPKVELHCHLDGAIPYRLFVKYCREAGFVPEGVSDEEWIAQNVMNESMSLSEGLEKFVLLTAILQTGDHLTEVTETLLDDMYNAGTRLAELRFAPQSHTQGELGMEEAVQAVLEGRRKALEKHPDMVVGILLCMMNYGQSWGNEINNRATIQLADKYRDQGVVGIDLAGDETATDINIYAPMFEKARELGLKYTIHAGESGPASNVQFAIDQKATRIGHGIHRYSDPEVVNNLVKNNVLLEISLTSNVLSSAVPSINEHPVKKLFDAGVKINLNTDDPELFNIDLAHEYELARNVFGFTEKELIQTNLDAARASFCPDKDKIIAQLEALL